VTNSISSFTFFIYEDEGMTWQPTGYNFSENLFRYNGYPAKIGYFLCRSDDTLFVVEDENSGEWAATPDSLNAYRVSEKNLQGLNVKGIAGYRLDFNDDSFINPRKRCNDWLNNEGSASDWAEGVNNVCPPSTEL
ncbi:unnamed protein product, partial [Owenia fusiformis]